MAFDVVLRNPGGNFNVVMSGGGPPPPTGTNLLRFAAVTPSSFFVGTVAVLRIYRGSTLVYEP